MDVEQFIERWQGVTGTERANYQLFLGELCAFLELEAPEPATDDTRDNAYVFERRVTIPQPDGSERRGYIDLYRRGAFVCEAKQTGLALDTQGWDKAMTRAYYQADEYARALPAKEGRPPFIIVTDVGRDLALYSDFSRSGANYIPFPDARSHRIRIEDLRDEDVRERLRLVWTDPDALDPTRQSARVTRDIADRLAKLAKTLEGAQHAPETVSGFLMRCLFTMFAEDVGLLPERAFQNMLVDIQQSPEHFAPMMESLWQTMDKGGFHPVLRTDLLRFNGGLFQDASALPLDRDQIELLIQAAKADWRYVEPSIFGTLLERALSPTERHKLGAHYTPRSYVERLVVPTVIEPLRDQWRDVQTAAQMLDQQGKRDKAIAEIKAFHHHLCDVRVLDPACGSGNFLYVALEHLKRLEGEILNLLHELGQSQGLLEIEGVTVDPHQFLGIEINPRAAGIAEIVLWIGYLQWHFRTHGNVNPPEPVLRNFHNIENRDALIDFDGTEPMLTEDGQPLTIWDGRTTKPSPVTGEPIPDESARTQVVRYLNPRKASWPAATYIIGNPPFIGASTMRRSLGDGYVDAIRQTWTELPESADFVMHWWHIAAEAVRAKQTERFGFITTNSLRQTFNRRVLEPHLSAKKPLSLMFAVPDHPWVDTVDGAAVRIAMTVGAAGSQPGTLLTSIAERQTGEDGHDIDFSSRQGAIFSDLTAGANVAAAPQLKAMSGISSPGVKLHGSGFIVTPEEAKGLGFESQSGIDQHIRYYRNGRDLTQRPRGVMVIDAFGLDEAGLRQEYPSLYQWIAERVKPERDAKAHTKDGAGYASKWWLFGKPRQELRKMLAGKSRYIGTVETCKHRFFTFLDASVLPDNMLINIASDDAAILGILSSRVHVLWSLATGGTLEDRPRYNKTLCFETFPFADIGREYRQTIAQLAEQIDDHRKRQQAAHDGLTITGMYNVLEKLRRDEPLTKKERETHEQGLVSVLRDLHDDLDRAVLEAYGWSDLAEQLVGKPGATTPWPGKPQEQTEAEEELLVRLVDLNAQRAAEEAQGHVRYLRPDYQAPEAAQAGVELPGAAADEAAEKENAAAKPTWPKAMRDQITAVRGALSRAPMANEELASQFKNKPRKSVSVVVDALESLGMIVEDDGRYRLIA